MQPLTFKTSSPAGDLIAVLAGIKELHNKTGRKAIIFQRLNMVGIGYHGAIHEFTDSNGDEVAMNEYMFNLIKPLLLEQDYIEDYIIYEGQEAEIDLDTIRLQTFTNQPLGSLNRWAFYVFPEMACNLSLSWLKIPYPQTTIKTNKGETSITGKAVINFTRRYRNHVLQYYFLRQYQNDIVFAGLQQEYDFFCKTWKLDIPLLIVEDFNQLSRTISNSKFFLGNQSMCFQIAEAIKIPRLLEAFQIMPNVIPVGENAFDFYHQNAAEYYVSKLFS